MLKRTYPSITTLLKDFPTATLLVNATGLGSLTLEDVKDTTLYPTRGQTVRKKSSSTSSPLKQTKSHWYGLRQLK